MKYRLHITLEENTDEVDKWGNPKRKEMFELTAELDDPEPVCKCIAEIFSPRERTP